MDVEKIMLSQNAPNLSQRGGGKNNLKHFKKTSTLNLSL